MSHEIGAARILVTATADETVVTVEADLDLRCTAQVRERLAEELSLRPHALIADFTRVTFCSAAGLSVLIETAAAAEAAGIPFVLAASQRAVLRPIRALGLAGVLPVARSAEEAVLRVPAARRPVAVRAGPRTVEAG